MCDECVARTLPLVKSALDLKRIPKEESMARKPREADIRSNVPEIYAAAMAKCQHGDPSFCSSDGECWFRAQGLGSCFADDPEYCSHCGEPIDHQ